ncbi:MAG: hypothetical protein PHU16_10025 [Atribacterota bacterium]|jgi:hypothetical protein|nr:hypothetical protein [Atribacterota bacterium]HHT09991.1 hypothetical protein [Candidatus Atribacteria bacterium]
MKIEEHLVNFISERRDFWEIKKAFPEEYFQLEKEANEKEKQLRKNFDTQTLKIFEDYIESNLDASATYGMALYRQGLVDGMAMAIKLIN